MQPGEKLGHYEIISLIGHGGMGEVYKARDPRVNRDVAIKSSREQFSERFEREAGAIAALNHPNICTLYDVGPSYLVMEFVEGQTLSDRIKEGPIPLEESLELAHQISDALESAHEKNIVHRDLKPGNIMIRPDGTVKVLDFGLAKMSQPGVPESAAVTVSRSTTFAGVVVGTPAYMSPEQAKGRSDVDKRADIWSFGVVFYELLTGERLFPGEDVTEVLAAVVLKEPSLDRVPVHFRRLLKKCLEKDPKRRLRDIGDVWDYIDSPGPVQTEGLPRRRSWLWPAATSASLVLAGVVLWAHWTVEPSAGDVVRRFNIPMPDKVGFGATLRMSPDGRYVVFRGVGEGGSRLWLRPMDTLELRELAGTEGVQNSPFWSPDSRTIVFGTQSRLMRISVSGGPPVKICDIPSSVNVGFWTADNRIVFGTTLTGIFEVALAGGTIKPLTELAAGEIQHAPQGLLPDGKHFLYLVRGAGENAGINIRSLDDKPATPGRRLLTDDSSALFAAASDGSKKPGWVLFVRESTLLAQPFDPNSMTLAAGDPVPLARSSGNLGGFSVSETGDLVYGSVTQANRQLDWYDRKGNRIETAWKGRPFNEIELSPDGTRVAVVDNPASANIWVHDFARKSEVQIATLGVHPVWSWDSRRLFWVGLPPQRSGLIQFYTRAASGADAEQPFGEDWKSSSSPLSWSHDGRSLLIQVLQAKTGRDVMVLPVDGGKAGAPKPYLNGDADETAAQFSPTDQYVAYVITAAGRSEVYVSTFPDPTENKWIISADGGYQPRWGRDGKELFYLTGDGRLMSVGVKAGPSPFGVPIELFLTPSYGAPSTTQTRWDVSRDGQKFLINTVTGDTSAPLTVVLNWQTGL